MYENESIEEQIVKLIRKFFFDKRIFSYNIEVDEFVNVAYIIVMNKHMKFFDSKKSNLSTFIYYVLSQNLYMIKNIILYNLSYEEANKLRRLTYKGDTKVHLLDSKMNVFNPLSLDEPIDIDNDNDNNSCTLLNMIFDEKAEAEYKKIEHINIINNIYVLLKKYKCEDKTRKIILHYISNGFCVKTTAEKFNCSKQNVSFAIRRFRRYINSIMRKEDVFYD